MFGRSKKRKQRKADAAEVKRLRKLLGTDAPEQRPRAAWARSAAWQARHALAVVGVTFAVWLTAVVVQAVGVSPVAVGIAAAVAVGVLKFRVTDWMVSDRDAAWTLYPSVAAGVYLLVVAVWA